MAKSIIIAVMAVVMFSGCGGRVFGAARETVEEYRNGIFYYRIEKSTTDTSKYYVSVEINGAYSARMRMRDINGQIVKGMTIDREVSSVSAGRVAAKEAWDNYVSQTQAVADAIRADSLRVAALKQRTK